MLQYLPDEAFGEVVDSLNGMYEFYDSPSELPLIPELSVVKARVTGSYSAPVYPVTEE